MQQALFGFCQKKDQTEKTNKIKARCDGKQTLNDWENSEAMQPHHPKNDLCAKINTDNLSGNFRPNSASA